MRADARLGGHFVQGHVDATGTLRRDPAGSRVHVDDVRVSAATLAHLIRKGSIAVDGISLTDRLARRRSLRRADHSVHLEHTNLRRAAAGRPREPRMRRARQVRRARSALAARQELHCHDRARRSKPHVLPPPKRHAHREGSTRQAARSPRSKTPSPPSAPASMVIVVDDEDRENEGDLTMAAEKVTPELDQLHGDARSRAGLPGDDAGAARRARYPARWCSEQLVGTRDRVCASRSRRRSGRAPASPRPIARRRSRPRSMPATRAARPRAARPRVSAARARRRRAGARGADRGGRGSRAHRRAVLRPASSARS